MRIIVFILLHLLVGVRGFCDEPDIPAHSFIKGTPQDGNNNRYDEGAYVVYDCDEDYTRQGNASRVCKPNGTWTKIKFECTADINCPVLKSIPNGQINQPSDNGGRNIFLSVAVYRCNKGYRINGTQSKYTRTCVSDSKWDGGVPSCQEVKEDTCRNLTVKHGEVKRDILGKYTVICNQGYSLNIPKALRKVPCECNNQRLQCARGRRPRCKPAKCDPPCENGGSCIRDGECRCNSHLITGDRCQTIICNDNCTINGGECTAPGICGKCPLSRSGENCEIQGKQCDDIGEFHGGDYVYIGDRGNGTEAHYFCDDGYSQGGNDVEMSVCEVYSDVAMWNPAPPTCYADAYVEVPKNGNTSYEDYMIAHGQSYEIYCPEGFEFDFNDVVNITRMVITNDNGTLIPEVPGCIPARCNPSQLDNTFVLYLNKKPLAGLISHGYPILYTCKPGYEFINEGDKKFIRGVCDFGKFQSVQECIPTICDPPCENGGSCIRDGECRCNSHLITGDRCQTFICNNNCTINGGECTAPGICGKCPLSRSGENCEIQGKQCDDIGAFHGGDYVYIGDRGNGTEAHYFCDDGYSQGGNDVEMSVCEVYNDVAMWNPAPPTCYADAFVEVPKNGNTTYEDYMIAHGQSYEIYCPEGLEFDFNDVVNITRMAIANDNGTLIPEVSGCIPARCNPSQLENTDILYLNGKPLVGLISNGYPFLYTCKPGYEFVNEGYTKFIRGVCDFGKFQSAQECIPSCFIPDNKDFTYMKNNGNVVATMDQIRNGEVLYVKCSDIDESEFDDYNDYADQNNVSVTSTPKPQVLPIHNVTCERGILTEPDIQCSQDLCHELKNGKVTKISYDTYEVKCDIGYTINLRENWDHECSCGGGQLTCRGHIPLCSPDNCVIPEDYDSSKMIIFKDNFQISRDTKVIHGDKVTIDCTEKHGNVMEPDDTEYECRAGQWIPHGKQWLSDYNGTFPECKIIKKGCQVPDLSGKSQVNSKDGSEVSEEQYSYVRDGVLIILYCDNGDVMNSYSCIDGNWATKAHENLLQKLKGLDSMNFKVSSSQQQGYIMALFETVVYETMEKFIAKVFQDRTLKCNTKERLD